MTEHDKEQAFLHKARSLLDNSADELEPSTVDALKQLRRQALSQPTRRLWQTPYPALAMAATVIIAVAVVVLNPATQPSDMSELEDLPMLTSDEELEFYQELDFYNWLDDAEIKS